MKLGNFEILSLALFLAHPFTLAEPKLHYLSQKVKAIHDHIVAVNEKYPSNAVVPTKLLIGNGSVIQDTVSVGFSTSHCNTLFHAMLQAEEEILIGTHRFDKSSICGKYAVDAIKAIDERPRRNSTHPFRFYIVVDLYHRFIQMTEASKVLSVFSDTFSILKNTDPRILGLPDPATLKNVQLLVKLSVFPPPHTITQSCSYHKGVFGSMHSNMLIVDGQRAVIGSTNWETLTAQEYTAVIDGPIVMSFRKDFERIINTRLPGFNYGPISEERIPMLYIGRRASGKYPNNDDWNVQNQALLKAFEVARKYVLVQAPNINTESFAKKVIETVKRGVRVILITNFEWKDKERANTAESLGSNMNTFTYLYKQLNETDWIRLHVCYFVKTSHNLTIPIKPDPRVQTNVKYVDIDGEFAFVGSANLDPQSFYYSSESNVIIDDAGETKRITTKLLSDQQSLEHCFFNEKGVDEYDVTEFWTP